VQVRRLRCANAACPRAIFAERLPGVTLSKARQTARLREAQTSIGLALGGEPGSRLAGKLAMPVSAWVEQALRQALEAAKTEPASPDGARRSATCGSAGEQVGKGVPDWAEVFQAM
jgi:hypothetical protein